MYSLHLSDQFTFFFHKTFKNLLEKKKYFPNLHELSISRCKVGSNPFYICFILKFKLNEVDVFNMIINLGIIY
jgi:hypothetical protein